MNGKPMTSGGAQAEDNNLSPAAKAQGTTGFAAWSDGPRLVSRRGLLGDSALRHLVAVWAERLRD